MRLSAQHTTRKLTMSRRASYHAYLLRLWRVQSEPHPTWRASLEDPHSSEVLVFASLERAYAFLADQIDERAEEPPTGAGPAGNDTKLG